jgi:hypothetical protein
MTDIDLQAPLAFATNHMRAVARIPLAGNVPGNWLDAYDHLAAERYLLAWAENGPDRAWIEVVVGPGKSEEQVRAALDEACELICQADRVADSASIESLSFARDWWERQRCR